SGRNAALGHANEVTVRVLRLSLLALACLSLPAPVRAEETVSLSTRRIELVQIVPGCPEALAHLDIGPAPPAGSSALFAGAAIRRAVERVAGAKPEPVLPDSVRVVSEAKTLDEHELERLARPAIENALPPGVRLVRVTQKSGLVLPKTATLEHAELPRLPKRAG